MIKYFSDRDPKAVAEHLNLLGESIEIINIFPVGMRCMAWYKEKPSSFEKDEKKEPKRKMTE